jgi:hypothetical protein
MKGKKRIHRRFIWLKSFAKKEPEIKEIADRLRDLFDESEIESVYALTADMMTGSHPFDLKINNEDDLDRLFEHVKDIYGFDRVDAEVVGDVLDEFADRHPERKSE